MSLLHFPPIFESALATLSKRKWKYLGLLFSSALILCHTGCQDASLKSSDSKGDLGQENPAPTEKQPSDEALTKGQARLNGELRRIRTQSDELNPYFGSTKVRQFREHLKRLDPFKAPGPTLQALMNLGNEEVDIGNIGAGIARLTEAYKLIDMMDVPNSIRGGITASLGFAYLRLAETENCCSNHYPESCIVPLKGRAIHTKRRGSEQAIKFLAEVYRIPDVDPYLKMQCIWLMNIACMTLGDYPKNVPHGYGFPPHVFQSKIAFPHFTNIAGELGIDRSNLAGGAILDDFDGDSDLDLITSTWDPTQSMAYFENKGDGTFQDSSERAQVSEIFGGLNLVHADYDNDGDLDVLVLRGAWMSEHGKHPNSLLQNQGNGVFLDKTFESGMGLAHYPTQTAAWADYDNDGDLDVYIGNESDRKIQAPSQLYQNQGDGTFIDVAKKAGVTNDAFAKGVVWGDIDGDRFPDIVVSNLDGSNRLYRNRGDGTFEDIATSAGVVGPKRSFPVWTWDFDNDGHLDIFISSYDARVGDFVLSFMKRPTNATSAGHFKGDGAGRFTNVAQAYGIDGPMLPMGANYGDLNNDGYLDFYLGTGEPSISVVLPNVMYLNQNGRQFADVTMAGGFGHLQKGHGISFADFDEDGDQDIFEQMGGAQRVDVYQDALFENPGFENNWLKVKLVGTTSNHSGVGARIHALFAETEESANPRSVYRHVSSGGSFGGNPLRQHIGLGKASEIRRLEIFWPTSNTTQVFESVQANQSIEITEGNPTHRVIFGTVLPETSH